MPVIPPSIELLYDFDSLKAKLADCSNPLPLLKSAVNAIYGRQLEQFQAKHNIVHLIKERSQAIDLVLTLAWNYYHPVSWASLLAVGGYGRGELHPFSDIDVLIVHDAQHDLEQETEANREVIDNLHAFIALLWDIGLIVGHSVRSISQCVKEAENDITIISNLMESRLITGNEQLYEQLYEQLGPEHIWPTKEFTAAKIEEKNKRYLKFNETAYNLEPNIKEGPGGLRDIQIIGWVAKRHFGVDSLKELVGHNFITPQEYETLEQGQSFLWNIRFALHVLCKRHEERLLFDHQRVLAKQFGYSDCEGKLAVECFMTDYYQTVMELERLNEMLLQYFQEVIIFSNSDAIPKKINRRFVNYKGYIAAVNKNVFRNYPFALLEIFLLLCQDPELKGVRASTIRLIRAHGYLIDDSFRKDLRCRTLFMEIMRQPFGITHEIRRMNRYGVLAEYIPVFKRIVGQMQHDLYHTYTVDEHTLKALRNARRIFIAKHAHEFPLASHVAEHIAKPELLYLAILFHDIAKGRGGNHEQLGALDAEQFCQLHDLNHNDTRLVVWLVRNHLIMSMTAQRKDINDPAVIHEFAFLVGEIYYLNYLYVLTLSDIRATSPKVWNSWKDALLSQLYTLTRTALSKGLDNPQQQDECIRSTKEQALKELLAKGYCQGHISQFWATLPQEYFIKFQVEDIIWKTGAILDAYQDDPEHELCAGTQTSAHQDKSSKPIVLIRTHEKRGGTEIFIYTLEEKRLFATVTATLSQLCLDVTEAKTITSSNGCTYQTYFVLESDGSAVTDNQRIETIKQILQDRLSQKELVCPVALQSLSRTQKQFARKTTVQFDEDLENNQTIMSITAANRPALLSHIGQALMECHIILDSAKISTFGEKVEDVFFIRDDKQQMITDIKKQETIRRTIIRLTDELG